MELIPKTKRRKCKDCKESFERYYFNKGYPKYCKGCFNNRRVFGKILGVNILKIKREFAIICANCNEMYDGILRDGKRVNEFLEWLEQHEHHKIIPVEIETPTSEELSEMVYDKTKDYRKDFIKEVIEETNN